MADTTADQAQRVRTITENLEQVRNSLIAAASHVTGLVRVGRATCKEVKTYNIWALGLYNLQIGLLAKLREMGETVPSLPVQPTYFAWRGVPGQQAVTVDCDGSGPQSLEGMLGEVFQGPSGADYLSLNEIEIVTQNPEGVEAAAAAVPSWGAIQEQQMLKQQGLGAIWFIIAGIMIAATAVAVSAIAHMFEVTSTNETTSEQNRLQAAAYESYLRARLECLQLCTSHGGTVESCTEQCKSIAPPQIGDGPGSTNGKWGFFQWAGVLTISALVLWGGHRLVQRKLKTGSFLPQLPQAWQLPD